MAAIDHAISSSQQLRFGLMVPVLEDMVFGGLQLAMLLKGIRLRG